jgi:hypothetical protein
MTEYLYHYTTIEKFLNGILQTYSIRLNSIQNVNDPIDSKIRYLESDYVIFSNQEEGEKYHEIKEKYHDLVNEKWIKNTKIACFSIDNSVDKIQGYQLSNLWSYYAENQTGLCLKLDKNKLIANFNDKYEYNTPLTGPVNYVDKISSAKYHHDYNSDHRFGIIKNKDSLFFEKLKVWDREQEYRIICFSTDDYEYISLDSILHEIILGQNCKKDYELIIKRHFPDLIISKMNYFIGDGIFEKIDIEDKLWRYKSQI